MNKEVEYFADEGVSKSIIFLKQPIDKGYSFIIQT